MTQWNTNEVNGQVVRSSKTNSKFWIAYSQAQHPRLRENFVILRTWQLICFRTVKWEMKSQWNIMRFMTLPTITYRPSFGNQNCFRIQFTYSDDCRWLTELKNPPVHNRPSKPATKVTDVFSRGKASLVVLCLSLRYTHNSCYLTRTHLLEHHRQLNPFSLFRGPL